MSLPSDADQSWPFGVELQKGAFHSYASPFIWDNIPMFTVLSGENGGGKTQLLRLIQTACDARNPLPGVTTRLTKGAVTKDAVVYAFGQMKLKTPGAVAQEHVLNELRHTVLNIRHGAFGPPQINYVWNQLKASLAERLDAASESDLYDALPEDFNLPRVPDPSDLLRALTISFYRYHLRQCNVIIRAAREQQRALTDDEIASQIGEPPWRLVNTMLERAGFKHRVTTPTMVPLDELYQMAFVCAGDDAPCTVGFEDLSSGEQTMLALACLLYNSEKVGVAPKLLLLDEPDVHLHPANLSGYLAAIQEVLVKRHGVRVIMTTHRPDTVALVPESSLFIVSRAGERVRPAGSKVRLVSALSASALAVLPNARCVWVEDHDDCEFYTLVRGILSGNVDYAKVAQLAFQSANIKKVGGGKGEVMNWVQRLQNAGLGHMVQGLIDRDEGTSCGPSLFVIGRYSHENYLLDPLIIYAALIDQQRAPAVEGVHLSPGQEYLLRQLPQTDLQRVADTVLGRLAAEARVTETATFEVRFVGVDGALHYPQWLRDTRGHDLQAASHRLYKLGLKELRQALTRLRMVPTDLADLLLEMTTS